MCKRFLGNSNDYLLAGGVSIWVSSEPEPVLDGERIRGVLNHEDSTATIFSPNFELVMMSSGWVSGRLHTHSLSENLIHGYRKLLSNNFLLQFRLYTKCRNQTYPKALQTYWHYVEIVLLYGHGDGGYLAGCFHEQFDNKFVRRSLLHSADAREKTDCVSLAMQWSLSFGLQRIDNKCIIQPPGFLLHLNLFCFLV
jgi:hypothetical protein